MIDLNKIDKTWTLFLDRDGVINHEKKDEYVNTWNEFIFYDGVLEAFKIFRQQFNRVILITNQRGVSKGITRLDDLYEIHHNMKAAVAEAGGYIDEIYFCTDMDNSSPNRKPQPGMGLQAVSKFADIDLQKAIMVGNKISDMEFGRNLGVHTIFLPTTNKEISADDERIDVVFDSLISFAHALPAYKL